MVFTEKPVSEQQRVASNLPTLWKHKARMCIRGDQHARFTANTTTTYADAHLVRLLLALHKSNHALSSTDITNAFLNANLTDGVFIPPYELVRLGLVPSHTLWECQKAIYGLKESPKLWEKERDEVLASVQWKTHMSEFYLQQSHVHMSLWYMVQGPKPKVVSNRPCVPDGTHPDCHTWVASHIVGALIVYVDDLLVSAPLDINQAFMASLKSKWTTSEPE